MISLFPQIDIRVSPSISRDADITRLDVYRQICVFGPDIARLCIMNGKCAGISRAARECWRVHRKSLKAAFNAAEQFRCEIALGSASGLSYPFVAKLWFGFGQKTLWQGRVFFGFDGGFFVSQ